jgi:hypothetical protein
MAEDQSFEEGWSFEPPSDEHWLAQSLGALTVERASVGGEEPDG